MKLIYWRCSALLLSWALMAAFLTWANSRVEHISFWRFVLLVASVMSYLICTLLLLRPLTTKPLNKPVTK